MGILRLAHVDVRTPDLELSTAYYTEVLGLQLAERGEDTVYLKCWDEEDHHSIRLRYDPRTGLDLFSFRVEHEDDLARLQREPAAHGLNALTLPPRSSWRRASPEMTYAVHRHRPPRFSTRPISAV